MAKPEQFFFPLMIAGAVAGIWALTRQPAENDTNVAANNFANDPQLVPYQPYQVGPQQLGTIAQPNIYTYNQAPVITPPITPPSPCGCDPCGTPCNTMSFANGSQGTCLQSDAFQPGVSDEVTSAAGGY